MSLAAVGNRFANKPSLEPETFGSLEDVGNTDRSESKPNAHTISDFTRDYTVTLSPAIKRLAQANILLLGEIAGNAYDSRVWNSRFISHLAESHPLVVFVDDSPVMKEMDERKAREMRSKYLINHGISNVRFLGCGDICYYEAVTFVRELCERVNQEIIVLFKSAERFKESMSYSELNKTTDQQLEKYKKLKEYKSILDFDVKKQIGNITTTLAQLPTTSVASGVKYVFISKADYLKPGKETAQLFEEVSRHKAAVMIPTI